MTDEYLDSKLRYSSNDFKPGVLCKVRFFLSICSSKLFEAMVVSDPRIEELHGCKKVVVDLFVQNDGEVLERTVDVNQVHIPLVS